jgi:hypothetical protein
LSLDWPIGHVYVAASASNIVDTWLGADQETEITIEIRGSDVTWASPEISVEHLSGERRVGRVDSEKFRITCSCGAELEWPHRGLNGPAGICLYGCHHCGALFRWTPDLPDVLTERPRAE